VYIRVWRYPVNFSVHYNIHYITFTILVRETWNDYHYIVSATDQSSLNSNYCISVTAA
jgi:hypothetical protein